MKIGCHVRRTREALELKQQDLADQVGVTSQHISRIELDQVAPSVQTLLKLSQTLGVTTDYLLTGRERGHDDGGYLIATVYTKLGQRRALARAQQAMSAYQERQAAATAEAPHLHVVGA